MNNNSYLTASAESLNAFILKVFAWMFAGLLVTAGVSFAFAAAIVSNEAVRLIVRNPVFLIVLFIVEIGLVINLSRSIERIGAGAAKAMFLLYAAINGVTLSFVFLMYTGSDITKAFVFASLFFAVMSVYGYFTKADLSSVGRILFVGLITIVIASIINVFLASDGLEFIICLAGVGVFVGLTAVDMQRIKSRYYGMCSARGEAVVAKTAILGALQLYLDFINLFLYILRLLGKRR